MGELNVGELKSCWRVSVVRVEFLPLLGKKDSLPPPIRGARAHFWLYARSTHPQLVRPRHPSVPLPLPRALLSSFKHPTIPSRLSRWLTILVYYCRCAQRWSHSDTRSVELCTREQHTVTRVREAGTGYRTPTVCGWPLLQRGRFQRQTAFAEILKSRTVTVDLTLAHVWLRGFSIRGSLGLWEPMCI